MPGAHYRRSGQARISSLFGGTVVTGTVGSIRGVTVPGFALNQALQPTQNPWFELRYELNQNLISVGKSLEGFCSAELERYV